MGLIDRLSTGIETLGRKANQALDEGKLRMDLLRVRRRKDNAARDLGYVVYRQAKGTTAAEGEVDFWVRKIGEAEDEVARLEEALRKVQEPASEVPPTP